MPATFQQQDQWCWAAVSKSMLSHYGVYEDQCMIAEYTRSKASWHNFGYIHCCAQPGGPCNYWNYLSSMPGSIQDILAHFAGLETERHGRALDQLSVSENIIENKPFVIRWGWSGGGGHFVVGHGFTEGILHFMDPWFGEGNKMATYDWVVSGGSHTWTHTLTMADPPLSAPFTESPKPRIVLYPNPVSHHILFDNLPLTGPTQYRILNLSGRPVAYGSAEQGSQIDVANFPGGMYLVQLSGKDFVQNLKFVKE